MPLWEGIGGKWQKWWWLQDWSEHRRCDQRNKPWPSQWNPKLHKFLGTLQIRRSCSLPPIHTRQISQSMFLSPLQLSAHHTCTHKYLLLSSSTSNCVINITYPITISDVQLLSTMTMYKNCWCQTQLVRSFVPCVSSVILLYICWCITSDDV